MNNRNVCIPLGMIFKKFYCSKCGTLLEKERTHRVVTKDDKDYYKYHKRGTFPRKDHDVYEHRFKCPSCGARISFEEQRIIEKIQKKLGALVLSSFEIKENYEECKKKRASERLRRQIITAVLVDLVIAAFFFFFETDKSRGAVAFVLIAVTLAMLRSIITSVAEYKGVCISEDGDSYSYEKENQLKRLHAYSSHNKEMIENSRKCHCFHCKSTFDKVEITDFADGGQTAVCPRCGIDSVLPDSIGEKIDEELIYEMYEYWF